MPRHRPRPSRRARRTLWRNTREKRVIVMSAQAPHTLRHRVGKHTSGVRSHFTIAETCGRVLSVGAGRPFLWR